MFDFAKKFLAGLGVSILFILFIELILLIFGVVPLNQRTDLTVGFSGYSSLFEKKTNPNGEEVYTTSHGKYRWFNPQSFPVKKEEGTVRIFCLGGSTTYGRPYKDNTSFAGWLREFLPKTDPTQNWEVINAGGISYASYRVARLMEELAEYEPDLIIVYSGHNEFLEARTYQNLKELPEFVLKLSGLASHLRIYSLLHNIFFDQQDLLSEEVKPILDNSVGPKDYHRDDQLRSVVLKDYENSLRNIVNLGEKAGAKTILVTPASNLQDFSPFKSESNSELTEPDIQKITMLKKNINSAIDKKNYEQAAVIAKQAVDISNRDADLLYQYGQILLKLNRVDEAKNFFIKSRDEDICPLRALSPTIKIVAKVAKEKNTGFLDFDKIVGELSNSGIPGSDLFLDHVHLTIDGYRHLALALIHEMKKNGILRINETWNEQVINSLSENVINSIDEREHAVALRNLSKVLAWAGKKEEAELLIDEAVKILPDDSESLRQKGSLLIESGDKEAALVQYREAVRLNPVDAKIHHTYGILLSELGYKLEAEKILNNAINLNPNLDNIYFDYGLVLHNLRKLKPAETAYRNAIQRNPNHSESYNNLGIVLAQGGNINAAYEQFVKALEVNPNNVDAKNNLARARKVLGR